MASHGHYRISRKAHLSVEKGGDPFWNESRVFSRWEAWQDLIQLAAYADHERMEDGKLVSLKRGEVSASVRFLAGRWSWSKSRVQRYIKLVTDMGRIAGHRRADGRDTYFIVKYDTYQGERDSGEPQSGTVAGQSRDTGGTPAGQREVRRSKKKKVEEGTSTPSRARRSPPEIHDSLLKAIPDFADLWSQRMEAANTKPKAAAEQKQVDSLAKLLKDAGPEAVRQCIRHSTLGGYQGLFPDRFAKNDSPLFNRGPRTTTGGRWEYGDPGADFEETPS